MTQIVMETTTTEDVVVEETVEKKDNLRHIVNPPNNLHIWRPGMTAQDIVDIARVRGIPVKALCGAEFVPTRNADEVKETCNVCLDVASDILNGL